MQEIIATLFSALVAGVGIAVGVVLFIAFVRQFLFIGRPNEVLIFSGRQQTMADGTVRGYRELIGGGRSFRWPLIEQVARMDLSTIPVEVKVAPGHGGSQIRQGTGQERLKLRIVEGLVPMPMTQALAHVGEQRGRQVV